MTIQPDDGYEQQRAALGRLYEAMNRTAGDSLTIAEIHEALAGPELIAYTGDGQTGPRMFIHRQTRHPGMLYTADTAPAVRDWLDQLTSPDLVAAGLHMWAEPEPGDDGADDRDALPGLMYVLTQQGPTPVRYGDTVILDVRGTPHGIVPEVLALAYHEEH